jgi:hypothetical protein
MGTAPAGLIAGCLKGTQKMRRIALFSASLIAAALLAGCGSSSHTKPAAQVASGQKVVITKSVWDAYINYKHWLMPKSYTGPVGDGYYAVTTDGSGWGLTGCPDNSCDFGTLDSGDAIDECSRRNGGKECLIFAHQDKIVVPYEIAQ